MEKQYDIHPRLEAEIGELSGRLESGADGVKKSPEIVSEFVGERIAEARREVSEKQESILPDYSSEIPTDTKLYVEQIVDGLWHDGDLRKAVARAEKGGALALDLFHDILSGKMSEELKKQGYIK